LNIDPVWHKQQVGEYIAEQPRYEIYARVLAEILNQACKLYAPLAIVQARPKTVSSFAEKAARKAFKYSRPVQQITDLCGARVITHTQEQADRICEFIREHFDVDEANSLDVRTRLKYSEFGYLSVHYVVQMRGDSLLGVSIPLDQIGGRKAELQVRTLLQHAWADISHDRLYKSAFSVPAKFMREGALLAAMLEGTDGKFARFVKEMDAYAGNYTAYMDRQKSESELAILELILRNEPKPANRPNIALSIARITRAAGRWKKVGDRWEEVGSRWEKIIEVLTEFVEADCPQREAIQLELGHALCRANKSQSAGKAYKRGQELLTRVARPESDGNAGGLETRQKADLLRAEALSLLAWSYSDLSDRAHMARDLYREALVWAPSDPYHLASFLEHEVYCTRSWEVIAGLRSVMSEAVKICREHADVGIELPRAFFTMGRLHLMAGHPYDRLANYAKGIRFCMAQDANVSDDVFDRELDFLSRINVGRKMPREHEWVRRFLLMSKSVRTGEPAASDDLKGLVIRQGEFRRPVLIVAGGADPAFEAKMREYRDCMLAALDGFEGTVLSGGTTAGVPGLVGSVTQELREKGTGRYTAVGYLSKYLPADAPKDSRYDELPVVDEHGFTPLGPIQTWVDLLAAGVRPSDVRVLGINGGRIAEFEYHLALALGATVGIIESSGRAASEMASDSDWEMREGLVWLPRDLMTIRAFTHTSGSMMDTEALEVAAEAAHEAYRSDNKHTLTDPSMLPWPELNPGLRESNRQQVAYCEQILRRAGYGIRPVSGEVRLLEFTDAEVEAMAELEHGRWNVERLERGWKYGPNREVAQKISPYLTPWDDLPEVIKEWDRAAVRNWPKVLTMAHLEIYRLK
jgi:ppGpp synthetase/RelA/SpoT-type nucleotidyltranferase